MVGPDLLSASDRDSVDRAVGGALRMGELNNSRAEGAPQQQVVNGWTTNDLLEIQISQQQKALELLSRQRTLLTVLIIGLAFVGLTGNDRPTFRRAEGEARDPSTGNEPFRITRPEFEQR